MSGSIELISIFFPCHRYQRKCDELELIDAKVRQEHEQITKDRDEMVAFLQKTLESRNDELADLNDRYTGLQV